MNKPYGTGGAFDGRPRTKRNSPQNMERRRRSIPEMVYDDSLPVSARRKEIADAIQRSQVLILCGETGSGKSTQLPKICMELGFGVKRLIGHTQPRRIAAMSIASRLAEELNAGVQAPSDEERIPPEKLVGYKIRFTDHTSADTCVKLMTDGILLAETQTDRFLNQYEVLIIDEAHERSLNIDFILGILRRLVDKRPDLKVIITSATIDAARFAAHFETEKRKVPILEISGRTYPVEVVYQPIQDDDSSDEVREGDVQEAVIDAVNYLADRELAGHATGRGDMLVFLPTERDIHELAKRLEGERQRKQTRLFRNETVDILPLYARLPAEGQQRIFHPGGHRRIVLSTNVAESSVTVPGIHYVIDTGTARILRYSARSKTQRLPIEAISRASADQRKGRCGRIGPGICVRLYSEEDYNARDRYTMPEIQRTNLASVILQTKMLNLGRIEAFPFLDPPKTPAIRDGYKTLFELQALTAASGEGEVTPMGEKLARLPVDPRIGRMVLAAMDEAKENGGEQNPLVETLIVAAALEIRDPRERPVEKQAEADEAHRQFLHPKSDFFSLLLLWNFYHGLAKKLTRNQLIKACRQKFLSWNRMREWTDVYHQLGELVGPMLKEAGLPKVRLAEGPVEGFEAKYDTIHRSLLSGLLSNVGMKSPTTPEYLTGGGGKGYLWPGSGLLKGKSKEKEKPREEKPTKGVSNAWVMAAEMVETSKRFLRTLAVVDPDWVERLGTHLVSRSYSEPHWSKQNNSVMVYEKVSLFGLPVVPKRRVPFGPVHPEASREMFLQAGLVEGNWQSKAAFYKHNQELLYRLEQVQAKLRRFDFLPNNRRIYDFYDRRIPLEVVDNATMEKWLHALSTGKALGADNASGRKTLESLKMVESDLVEEEVDATLNERFPDSLPGMVTSFPLEYHFEPGAADDGVLLKTSLETVRQIVPQRLEWGIPGFFVERVTALIKSLPKDFRRRLVPAPDTAVRVCRKIRFGEGKLLSVLATELTREAGCPIRENDFDLSKIPPSLEVNIRVSDAEGKTLVQSRDFHTVLQKIGNQAEEKFAAAEDKTWTKKGLTAWDFGELPVRVETSAGLVAFPMLQDEGKSVAMGLASSQFQAESTTRQAVTRLFRLGAYRELSQQAIWMPGYNEMAIQAKPFCEKFLLPFTDVLCDFLAASAIDPSGFPKLAAMTPLLREIPRTREAFDKICKEAKGRISLIVQDAAAPLRTFWKAYHDAVKAMGLLSGKPKPAEKMTLGKIVLAPSKPASGTQAILEDMEAQLEALMPKDFPLTTPWTHLRHFARYFQGITTRVETLRTTNAGMKNALTRGVEQMAELAKYRQAYEALAEDYRLRCVVEPKLEELRWMLEEYRISLFAQKLGTATPVSAKRLDKMIQSMK
ncbi:MAG: ATP-dependent RNA helicase HrpA [Planctomycetia bacterium]|nr:ATP-dependent RNA helicase HrpA [Planctomycetia bacterium]